MSTQFKTFVEVQNANGDWEEANVDTGFLAGYCSAYDGYITEDLYVGLCNLSDGYFQLIFKEPMPTNLSSTVRYKLRMMDCLDLQKYCLTLTQINQFNWNMDIYGSTLTVETTFYDVAPNFLLYYVPALTSLGLPDQVRLIIVKKG